MADASLACNGVTRKPSFIEKFYKTVTRKKAVGYHATFREEAYAPNSRWIGRSLLDITTTGLSNTIGSPLYILTGFVLRRKAGPAIILSYLIASVSSVLAALTYSELVNQISTHGSDYLYSYVTMGELYGFLVGWNLILEYCVDVASVSKALCEHVDKMYFGGDISAWQLKNAPMDTEYFSEYVDFFSIAFCFILTLIIAMGGKFSNVVNNFFTCFNLVCYVSIMVFGSFSCDLIYWYESAPIANFTLNPVQGPPEAPASGFLPWGFTGALRGAGSCIFAFAGFRAIFTDGVKSRNPKRNLPIASISTLVISTGLYLGVSFTISCMIPSWKIDTAAPIFSAFSEHNLMPLQKLLAIGAIAGLVQASVYKFLPLPPLLTMMSEDGLLFKFLGEVDKETGGPFKGTVFYGIVSTIFVAVFVLEELIDMLSIGTLIAYMMAAVSIIRIRYRPYPQFGPSVLYPNNEMTVLTERKVKVSLIIYLITVCVFGIVIANVSPSSVWFIASASVLSLIMIVCGFLIYNQPQNIQSMPFSCPCVPVIPLFSIFLNAVLMMHLSYKTWVRFSSWMGIGLIVYFTYSIRFSHLGKDNAGKAAEPASRRPGPFKSPKRTLVKRTLRRNQDGQRYEISHTPVPKQRSRSQPAHSRSDMRLTREQEMAARLREWNDFLRAEKKRKEEEEREEALMEGSGEEMQNGDLQNRV